MSAIGTKRTSWCRRRMSAFGGRADITLTCRCLLLTQSGHSLSDLLPSLVLSVGAAMRRREFIFLLAGAAAIPHAALAQQAERVRRIGVLIGLDNNAEGQARLAAFRNGMHDLGWSEGQNIQLDVRRHCRSSAGRRRRIDQVSAGRNPRQHVYRGSCTKKSDNNNNPAHVRYWHKADIPLRTDNVRYWGKADMPWLRSPPMIAFCRQVSGE